MRIAQSLILTGAAILSLGGAAPLAAAPACTGHATDLPTVDEVIAGAFKAVGGREAVQSITTLRSVFEMDFGGQKVTSDNSWSRDGGRLAKMSMPGMGEMVQGTDGKVAWRKSVMGYTLLEGKEAEQFESQSNMFRMVLEPDRMAREDSESIEVQARESFAGKDCYRLHFLSKEKQEGDVFFDADSGILVGSRQTAETPRGRNTTTMTLADWEEAGGVKFFRTINVDSTGGMSMGPMVMKVTALEVNSIGADAFILPEEVRKLAAASAAKPAEGGIKLSDLAPALQARATEMIEGLKKAGTSQVVKQALSSLETAAKYAPEAEKKMYEYVVQELNAFVKSLEGGR